MSRFITDDFCEEVVICDPKVIEQDCLPGGEDLVCLYTIEVEVPYYYWDRGWYSTHNKDYDFSGYDKVTFELDKVVKVDEDTGIQQEVWLAHFNGGIGNDKISGEGFLQWMQWYTSSIAATVTPSTYLGDLIHFQLSGGSGNDKVTGANNADILNGDSGNDTVRGLDGDDNIDGGRDNDLLFGDGGNDFVNGGTGNDTASGGTGHDELTGGSGNDVLYGDSGDDNLYGDSGNDELWGGSGNDWSFGDSGEDTIISSSGDDCADGGDGDDLMIMGSGDDLAVGGNGNDTINGESGNDKLDGQDGDDVVDGGSGEDLVVGGAGDDTVFGGAGDDIVRGGTGEDVLWGDGPNVRGEGEGCDVFAFCEISLECQDIIKDFDVGYNPDQIDLSALAGQVDTIRVEETGTDQMARLALLGGGDALQQILVDNVMLNSDLRSVFEKDTTYGTDDGAIVKLGAGMMVDLPSTSVISSADDGMFIV